MLMVNGGMIVIQSRDSCGDEVIAFTGCLRERIVCWSGERPFPRLSTLIKEDPESSQVMCPFWS